VHARQPKWYGSPVLAGLATTLALAAMVPGQSYAQARLEAQYTMSLAGLPIGKGTWVIDISENQYASVAKGGTIGLLRAFAGGEGTTTTQGTTQGGKPVASTYVASVKSSKKSDETRLTIAKGDVKDLKIVPPPEPDDERIPVTEDNQHGILDPMTATLVRMPGAGNPMAPEACQRNLPIFDGKLRYDLQLAFKRMDKVKADKGYEGPVVVCAVYFTPIAGHIPSRTAIKYMTKLKDIEVWLAPIAGTRVLVPYRAAGPTPVGMAVLEATQFVSVAKEAAKAPATRAASSEPKPQ
jgi:hypothetical protein